MVKYAPPARNCILHCCVLCFRYWPTDDLFEPVSFVKQPEDFCSICIWQSLPNCYVDLPQSNIRLPRGLLKEFFEGGWSSLQNPSNTGQQFFFFCLVFHLLMGSLLQGFVSYPSSNSEFRWWCTRAGSRARSKRRRIQPSWIICGLHQPAQHLGPCTFSTAGKSLVLCLSRGLWT